MTAHIDLTKAIASVPGQHPPLVINVVTTPRTMEVVGGVPSSATRTEQYVLYSALPSELKERVKLAIQALVAAG